jgi:hypothetical protein
MSLEHIFSKATARKDPKTELAVKGMANMPDQSIGFDGPKSRILCKSHNSRLSSLDSEAKKLADGLHKFVDGAKDTTVHLSGLLFERWVLKTVINYLASGLAHKERWLPNADLVRCVFGLNSLPSGCGLYLLRLDQYAPISTEQTGITPAWRGTTDGTPYECVGAIVYLHGAAFFLLLQLELLDSLRASGLAFSKSDLPLTYERLKYHPRGAIIDDGRGHTMSAVFDWA